VREGTGRKGPAHQGRPGHLQLLMIKGHF